MPDFNCEGGPISNRDHRTYSQSYCHFLALFVTNAWTATYSIPLQLLPRLSIWLCTVILSSDLGPRLSCCILIGHPYTGPLQLITIDESDRYLAQTALSCLLHKTESLIFIRPAGSTSIISASIMRLVITDWSEAKCGSDLGQIEMNN